MARCQRTCRKPPFNMSASALGGTGAQGGFVLSSLSSLTDWAMLITGSMTITYAYWAEHDISGGSWIPLGCIRNEEVFGFLGRSRYKTSLHQYLALIHSNDLFLYDQVTNTDMCYQEFCSIFVQTPTLSLTRQHHKALPTVRHIWYQTTSIKSPKTGHDRPYSLFIVMQSIFTSHSEFWVCR